MVDFVEIPPGLADIRVRLEAGCEDFEGVESRVDSRGLEGCGFYWRERMLKLL